MKEGQISQQSNQTILLTLGTRLSPDPSNKSGRILANCLLCSRFCLSINSFCCCSSSFFCIFIITFSTMTIEPSIIPPNIPFFRATLAPERKASSPPVMAPATIWLNASSFFLIAIMAQSVAEKSPAQMAKLPPRMGARFLRSMMPPMTRSRLGAYHMPRRKQKTTPPVQPREKPLPKSSIMRQGHGCSRILITNHLNYIIYYQTSTLDTSTRTDIRQDFREGIQNQNFWIFGQGGRCIVDRYILSSNKNKNMSFIFSSILISRIRLPLHASSFTIDTFPFVSVMGRSNPFDPYDYPLPYIYDPSCHYAPTELLPLPEVPKLEEPASPGYVVKEQPLKILIQEQDEMKPLEEIPKQTKVEKVKIIAKFGGDDDYKPYRQPSKRIKGQIKQKQDRNLIPNTVHHLLAFVQKKFKSSYLVEKILPQLAPHPHYTSSRYYNFHRMLRVQINNYVNEQAFRIISEPGALPTHEYGQAQQEFYCIVSRVIVRKFLKVEAVLMILRSRKVKRKNVGEYLSVQRYLYENMRSLTRL